MSRLIDADALDEVVLDLNTNRGFGITRCDYKMIDAVLFEFPTIEERKTGKWIQDQKSKRYRCDQCLSFALKTDDMQENLSDFCPVCGAKMEGEQP